jgi:hypothetical protein
MLQDIMEAFVGIDFTEIILSLGNTFCTLSLILFFSIALMHFYKKFSDQEI